MKEKLLGEMFALQLEYVLVKAIICVKVILAEQSAKAIKTVILWHRIPLDKNAEQL